MRDDLGLFEGYHSPQIDVAVRLNTNESPFPPPTEFSAAVANAALDVQYHRYPDRNVTSLRHGLAQLHSIDFEQIVVGNGSNEVLQALCLAYGGPGRNVAVFEPTYAMHSAIARVSGATVVEGERSDDFSLDLGEVERVLGEAEPAITFLCSPNNPTGNALPPEVVEKVLALAPGIVVVDEAYGQFSTWTALDQVSEDRALVVTRTFSKTWSLAAMRLGYLVGPRWVAEDLSKVLLPYHVDALKQRIGRIALQFTEDMEQRVSTLVEERGRIAAALAELPVDTWRSDANFILLRPQRARGRDVWQGLVDRGVLVRDCSGWPRLEDCLRMTVGTPDENTRFLEALQEVLA